MCFKSFDDGAGADYVETLFAKSFAHHLSQRSFVIYQ
jgi:hypothetical protein